MLYRVLPIVILGLTAALTTAAIEFLPETLFFPVVEYSSAENIRITMHKTGELDRGACEQSIALMAQAIHAQCPVCKVVERCLRGLSADHKQVLSREPLALPSVRLPGGVLTMTIATNDPGLSLGVCRQIEAQSALQPVDKRFTCQLAGIPR